MKCKARATWRNHHGNQAVQPVRVCWPETLDDLVSLVRMARDGGVTARAVGAGHSWSDVALCTGYVAETTRLDRVLALDAMPDERGLFRVEAGMRIRALNAALDRAGLALENLGGYDGQSVAGVISTATHGSGLGHGPLSDAVRSLDLVAGDGTLHRVEPAGGPTDPDQFERAFPTWELHQDDHWFDAVRVGMGCLGLIYAVTLAVVPAFELTERRVQTTWEEVAPQLRDLDALRRHPHYEVYLSPYLRKGRRRALITTRTPPVPGEPRGHSRRNPLLELVAGRRITYLAIDAICDTFPRIAPFLLDKAIEGIADRTFTSAGYKVFNIGAANASLAYSSEIGVPVDEAGTHVEAVERIIALAERRRELGGALHTAPIALRFVRPSSAYMAMMHGRETMMIELILLRGTEGGYELLGDYEDALYAIGGRPHWGQVNTITGSRDFLRSPRMYPESYDRWQDVRAQLDPHDVFDGPYPKRAGLIA